MRTNKASLRKAVRCGAILALLATILGGCATAGPDTAAAPATLVARPPSYPAVTFVVLSDTHIYDSPLGTSGKAWDAYMASDRKLLKDSEETLQVALQNVKLMKPAFVLVTGDLTKDGEKQCHEKFASSLADLKAAGISSYVVPGNHDVNNPDAARFLPSGEKQNVPTVTPEEFARIYADFGYGSPLYRDPASLSYIAEPTPGLWLLALDSAKYENNAKLKYPETSGAIRPTTHAWIEQHLKEAAEKGVALLVQGHDARR